MDFFDFAPKTDEELAAAVTEDTGGVDADLAAKAYEIKDDLQDGDGTLLEKDEPIIPEKVVEPKAEKVVETVQEVSDLSAMLEDIADDLEANEMLLVPNDITYEPTVSGLKELLKDNYKALKTKLEEENNEILAAKLAEIEGSTQVKFADMSTEDSGNAELMLTKWYEATGLDEEEIADKLAELNDLGLLSKEAKLAQKFLVRTEKEQEVLLKETKAREVQEAAKENETYVANLKKAIQDTEDVIGIKPTAKQKKEFTDYLFKFDREGKTQAMKDSEDESKRLELAWMQYLKFNAKTLETTARTKVVNDIEKKQRRFASVESTTKGVTNREADNSNSGLKRGALDFWAPSRSED